MADDSIDPDFQIPERHSSAPPALEIQKESVFAWTVEYAKIFTDIRAHEDYLKFYEGSYEKDKLPPPLESSLYLEDEDYQKDQQKFDQNALQAQLELQQLNIGRTAKTDEDVVWTPRARRMNDLRFQNEQIISSWSSPTAQTAFKSAQFILSEDPGSLKNSQNIPQDNADKDQNEFNFQSGSEGGSETDEQQPSGKQQSVLCRYFANGFCSRGEKCFYSHDMESGKGNFNGQAEGPIDKGLENIETGTANKQQQAAAKNSAAIRAKAPSPIKTELLFGPFDQLKGKIYQISKDQQGCRFLQKKLEEQKPDEIQTIFEEVYEHITELMTDPFGNYLCQKLIEFCNDEQRYLVVERVAPNLVEIAKNMHGTRAVQKMVEFLSTPQQIAIVRRTLSDSVVELIKDLNGNHVIQRCLNKLQPEDNQFIYDAVTKGTNCIQVATHRHGCCVLQRCIDHASKQQKIQLLNDIIKNSLPLVQDPYGNYVVQYALELPFPEHIARLIQSFFPHLRLLATQKFSSNVIEKCLSVSNLDLRRDLIAKIGESKTLIVLLQDPYGNYVVQTAMNSAEPFQHRQLVEAIKPHLNLLRNTPYGKRIQNKIAKG